MEPKQSIVRPKWTNPPIETILFNQIILLHRTIINGKNGEKPSRELVRFLWSILDDPVSREVVISISKMVVFTVRGLHKGKPAAKTTAYEVVDKLRENGIVEDTIYKASNPPKDGKTKYSGPKSTFFKLRGYVIEDINRDPYIRNAQKIHNETFQKTAQQKFEESRQAELLEIVPVVVDYFIPRRDLLNSTSSKRLIREYVTDYYPDLEPSLVSLIVKSVIHELHSKDEFE